jgi:hypothetical protein
MFPFFKNEIPCPENGYKRTWKKEKGDCFGENKKHGSNFHQINEF